MDFLLEVGCEEIPARFLPPALTNLERLFRAGLEEARLGAEGGVAVQTSGTPRRLVLKATGLPNRQPDLDEEVLGPKVAAAYDREGQPTKACMGFARSRGVEVDQLEKVETSKGVVVAVRRQIEGRPIAEVLGRVVEGALANLAFPKTMRWGSGEHLFARPVHWLLALIDDQLLDLEFGGVKSGRSSRGHRFASPDEFEVASCDGFEDLLREKQVEIDPATRRSGLIEGARSLATEAGGRLVEDSGLEEEVTYLTEFPVPLLGRFDEAFLALPRGVLVAAMRNHQRYFSIEKDDGSLLNAFVAIGNTPVDNPDQVRHGNERVLTARLADARFFFDVDQKKQPSDLVPGLQDMVFQADLGSYYDKAIRVANLAVAVAFELKKGSLTRISRVIEALTVKTEELSDDPERFSWRAARAALLAKTDLLTEMVGEFPELQGEMGGDYAQLAGEEEAVAEAIRQHYRPRFSGDAPPDSEMGAILSIADRLDTLAGCFGVGLRPTGGADPYALRRQCLGVIGIVEASSLRLSIRRLLTVAVDGVRDKVEASLLRKAQSKARRAAAKKKKPPVIPDSVEPFENDLVADLVEFFSGRLRQRLVEVAPADVVDAVLAVGVDDLTEARLRAKALADFATQPAFEDLAIAFKRVANIIKGFECAELDPGLFSHEEESQLYNVYTKVTPDFDRLVDEIRFDEAMDLLAKELRGPVDRFFEAVLVNDPDDPARQANRKALLSGIATLFGRIADFTRLHTREAG